METIGQRIAIGRLNKRWTQERLASELGITQSLLSDIENDKVSPKWDLIESTAEKLNVPLLSLLPQHTANIFNGNINDNGMGGNIIHNYRNTDEERELWEALLKAKDETIAGLHLLINNLQQTH